MGRPIKPKEKWRKRVLKQIPSEVITAYTGALGIFASIEDGVHIGWRLGAFFACIVAIPLWLWFGQSVKKWWQLLAGIIAFVLWDMTMPGGLFEQWDAWKPAIGTAFLGLYIYLFAPLIAGASSKQRDAATADP